MSSRLFGVVLATVLATAASAAAGEGAGSTNGGAAPGVSGMSSVPPADAAFVAKVRAAVLDHDLDYFDKTLVDWDGARKRTQRLTLFQIRECFGRPIKTVSLEPWTADPAVPLTPAGYRTNRPVTHLLRIAFDEGRNGEDRPACVLMLSKDPNASYHMVLVLPDAPPPK